jgi:xanthine/uracil/vitamin C permease (AzgA family)
MHGVLKVMAGLAVVSFQHKHYGGFQESQLYSSVVSHQPAVPLALTLAFVLPTALGWSWGDPLGAFIWGGLVTRLMSTVRISTRTIVLTSASLALHVFSQFVGIGSFFVFRD